MKGHKKGSIIVEASFIYPLIILLLSLLINQAIQYYQDLTVKIDEHNRVSEEAVIDGQINFREAEFIRIIDNMAEVFEDD